MALHEWQLDEYSTNNGMVFKTSPEVACKSPNSPVGNKTSGKQSTSTYIQYFHNTHPAPPWPDVTWNFIRVPVGIPANGTIKMTVKIYKAFAATVTLEEWFDVTDIILGYLVMDLLDLPGYAVQVELRTWVSTSYPYTGSQVVEEKTHVWDGSPGWHLPNQDLWGITSYWQRPISAWTDWSPKETSVKMTHAYWLSGPLTNIGTRYFNYGIDNSAGAYQEFSGYADDWYNFNFFCAEYGAEAIVNCPSNEDVVNSWFGRYAFSWTYSDQIDLVAAVDHKGSVILGSGGLGIATTTFGMRWQMEWGSGLPWVNHVILDTWHPPDPSFPSGQWESAGGGFLRRPIWDPPAINSTTSNYIKTHFKTWSPSRFSGPIAAGYNGEQPFPPAPPPVPQPTFECEDLRPFGTICSNVIRERDLEIKKYYSGCLRRNSMWDGGDLKLIEDLCNGQEMQADRLHRHDKMYETLDNWASLWYKKTGLYKPQPEEPVEKLGADGSGGSLVGYENAKFNRYLREKVKYDYNWDIDAVDVDTIDEALWVISYLVKGLQEREFPPVQETMHTSGRLLNWTYIPLPNNNTSTVDSDGNSLDGKWKDGTDVREDQCSWIVSPAQLWGLGGGALPWVWLCSTFGKGVGGDQADDFDFNPRSIVEWITWIKAMIDGQFFYGRWFMFMFFLNWTDILNVLFSILGLYGNYHIVGSHWWTTEMDATVMDHASFWNVKEDKYDNARKKMKQADTFPPDKKDLIDNRTEEA